jgi:hypothetical protein
MISVPHGVKTLKIRGERERERKSHYIYIYIYMVLFGPPATKDSVVELTCDIKV